MKAIKGLITALLLSAPLFANAYWEQTINFNPAPLVTEEDSYSFTHDLTTVGFNPLSDTVSSYDLTIRFYDDKRGLLESFSETVVLSQNLFNAVSQTFSGNWTAGSLSTGETISGLFSLNMYGELLVTVAAASQWLDFDYDDFYLSSSTLTAHGSSTSVPEPSSLALLAAGLFGIAAMRRSAARNNG